MSRRRKIQKRTTRKRRSINLAQTLGVTFVVLFLVLFIAASAYSFTRIQAAYNILPQIDGKLAELRTEDTVILSADGVELYRITPKNQDFIPIDKVPKLVVDATVASEDHRFYEHKGVDPFAMASITVEALFSGGFQRGGSTITMQIAKLYFSNSEQTFERKMNDMALAFAMEKNFTKDNILEMYLNSIYYGGSAQGIVAAAEVYFDKDINDLTLMEAAMLARSVRRPSEINPQDNYKRTREWALDTLAIMKEQGMITQAQYDEAVKEEPKVSEKKVFHAARGEKSYIVDETFRQVRSVAPGLDLARGGYTVVTTFDTRVQKVIDDEVASAMRRYRGRRVNTAAVVVMDKDGRVLGLAGGSDYKRSQYNYATQGGLPTGSSFKPFTYAVAIENGAISARGSIRNDTFYIQDKGRRRPIQGGGGGGSVSVARALYTSNNTAAMWVQKAVGTSALTNGTKTIFGIDRELPQVPTLTLGPADISPIEMAEAYTVFQSQGTRVKPRMISRIESKADGVIFEGRKVAFPGRLRQSTARNIDAMLRSVVTASGGTGRAAGSAVNARGKTGTTSNFKDAWFCGYTDELVAVVWVGNLSFYTDSKGVVRPRHNAMAGVMGGQVPAPFWGRLVSKIQQITGEKASRISTAMTGGREIPESNRSGDESDEGSPEDSAAPIGEDGGSEVTPDVTPEPTTPAPSPSTPVNPPSTTAPAPARPAPSTSGGQTVTLEICADSRQVATIACPERVTRTYPRGSAPSSSCSRHRLN